MAAGKQKEVKRHDDIEGKLNHRKNDLHPINDLPSEPAEIIHKSNVSYHSLPDIYVDAVSNANSAQKSSIIEQLQQSHGNSYVQHILKLTQEQAKLRVTSPSDVYEKQADEVATEAMQFPSSRISSEPHKELDEFHIPPMTERYPSQIVSRDLEERINKARGSGNYLNEAIVNPLEQRLGQDLRQTHIHTDTEADRLSRQLGADAFTVGHDIFFREGFYRPESGSGRNLIAHELTHVAQQSGTADIIQLQQAAQPAQQQAAQQALTNYTGTNFRGAAVQCDTQFVNALTRIDNYAGNRNVEVHVTSSFRALGQAVQNAIVQPAATSNHHAGHAIDMNIWHNRNLYNSAALHPNTFNNLPQAVQDFLNDIRGDAGLRWGGDFTPTDPVHIDDGLNVNDPALYQQRVNAVQPALQQAAQPAQQPTAQPGP